MIETPGRRVLHVEPEARGARLDAWLAGALPDTSRSRWRALIEGGHVTVDGAAVRPAHKLQGGEAVEVAPAPPLPTRLEPQDIPLSVLFEDDDLIVVDKPAGLVVHPAAGNPDGTLVNALLFHVPGLVVGGVERPGIVHRLDKDTSGVMVCAKHDAAHRALSGAFKARDVDKTYLAFTHGRPKRGDFELVTGHRRHPTDRRRFTTRLGAPEAAEAAEAGGVRRASARYRVVASAGGVSEVEVALHTGRTHQIRAQLADVGHPLLEDALYGGRDAARRVGPGPVRDAVAKLHRQALHASRLGFPHPRTGARVDFEAPLPDDLQRLVAAMRAAGQGG